MGTGQWYKLPLVAGNHIGCKDGIIAQDGFIGSFQAFLLLACFGFGITVSAWLTHDSRHGVKMADLYMCLVLYMITSCLLILFMYKTRLGHARPHRSLRNLPSSLTMSDRLRRVIKDKLPLVGIVCFFVPSIFLDLFNLAAFLDCFPSIFVCGAVKIYEYVSIISFHVCRMAFLATLVAFAMFFHRRRFTTNVVIIRYILMFILASTIVMWFDTFVHDFSHVFKDNNSDNDINPHSHPYNVKLVSSCNGLDTTNSSIWPVLPASTIMCLNFNTTQFKFLRGMSPFFYPLNIEFALLVTEIVANLYFSLAHFKQTQSNESSLPLTFSDTNLNRDEDGDQDVSREETHIKVVGPSPNVKTTKFNNSLTVDAAMCDHEALAGSSAQPNPQEPVELLSSSPLRSSLRGSRISDPRRSKQGKLGVRIRQPSQTDDLPDDIRANPHSEQTPLLTPGEPCISSSTFSTRAYGTSQNMEYHGFVQMPWQRTRSDSVTSTDSTASFQSLHERRAKLFCSVITAIILNAIFFTMVLLDFFQVESDSFLIIYHLYCVGYYVLFICWIYYALKKCEMFNSRFQPYSGLELLLVFSAAGFYLHFFMSITAYCAHLAGTDPLQETITNYIIVVLSLTVKVLDMWSLLVQTPFMLHATRIEAPFGHEKERNSLKQCLMLVAVCNIFIWIINSFIEIKHLEIVDPYQVKYYGIVSWSFITHIILPLIIFYRFNSFFILLGGFLDH